MSLIWTSLQVVMQITYFTLRFTTKLSFAIIANCFPFPINHLFLEVFPYNGFQFFRSYAKASSIGVFEEVGIVVGVVTKDGTPSIDGCCELGTPIDFDE